MKRMKDLQKLKTSTMVWLTGLTIGLALVVAALVAMATGSDVALYWIHKRVISSHPAAPELVKTPRISIPASSTRSSRV